MRARRGANWLDRTEPGWYNRVDVDKIDLSSDSDCILGQVFGSYSGVVETIVHTDSDLIYMLRSAVFGIGHGFVTKTPFRQKGDVKAWRRQIEKRLNADRVQQMRREIDEANEVLAAEVVDHECGTPERKDRHLIAV